MVEGDIKDIWNINNQFFSVRFDINISFLIKNKKLTRVEIKNTNSFESIERSLAYEIELWNKAQLLNGNFSKTWDDDKKQTIIMREKLNSNLYWLLCYYYMNSLVLLTIV